MLFILLLILPVTSLSAFSSFVASDEMPKGKFVFTCLADDYWQIWTHTAQGTQQVTFTPTDKKRPRWSKSGGQLVYQTNNGEIFIIDADGNEQRIAAELGIATDPTWSFDDTALYLSVFRSAVREDSEIWRIPLDDSVPPERLTSEIGLQYNPDLSPDGRWLIYTSGAGEATHELYRLDLEKGDLQQLTDNTAFDLFARWSPDGQHIVYVSDQAGSYDLWMMQADGSATMSLTSEAGLETGPVWSPDGTWIAFESNRAGSIGIWAMSLEGGEPQLVSPNAMNCRNVDWGLE